MGESNIQYLEGLSLTAWPSLHTLVYDGWLLRFSAGYTKRANSINPLFSSTLPLEEKLSHCERLYSSRGLKVIFKLTHASFPANLDTVLDDKGYKEIDCTSVQTLSLTTDYQADHEDFDVYTDLSAAWVDAFCSLNRTAAKNRSALVHILERILPPTFYVSLLVKGKVVSCGFAVLDGSMISFYDIFTKVSQRKKGYGEQIMLKLLQLGKEHGATSAFLQVMKNNIAALRLYNKLGFKEEYIYWYRVK